MTCLNNYYDSFVAGDTVEIVVPHDLGDITNYTVRLQLKYSKYTDESAYDAEETILDPNIDYFVFIIPAEDTEDFVPEDRTNKKYAISVDLESPSGVRTTVLRGQLTACLNIIR